LRRFRYSVFMMILDILAVNFALFLGFFLRFSLDGAGIPSRYMANWLLMIAFVSAVNIVFFTFFGLYRSLWRYSSLPELYQVLKAVTAASALIIVVAFLIDIVDIPRSVIVIAWFLKIFFIGGIRLAVRIYRQYLIGMQRMKNRRRVLIVGAGLAGAMLAMQMRQNSDSHYEPIAFLDDDPRKLFCSLHGIPIVGRIADLRSVVAKYRPDEVLFAIPSARRGLVREIIKMLQGTNIPVRMVPSLADLPDSTVSLQQIREVRIEDLLGREPVEADLSEIASYLRDERVLVTGAGGSIGSELCRQIAGFDPELLLLLGRGENSIYEIDQELNFTYGKRLKRLPIIADIRDRAKMEQVFRDYRPTVIFHAAAHKHVPLMENAPEEAVKNNIFGTKNLVELADKYGVKRFVLISTDKAVNPTNVMGATKRVAEMVMQYQARKSQTKFCAVRFGNVLGSRGSVIQLFKKQIERGGPVTVTHPEMTRFFMTIPEAVSLVIQAGAMGENGEVFILDMGEPVKIYDLACELIRLSGLEPGVDIEITCCGIRPGEKLYEEILTAEEGTTATKHQRIFVGQPNGVDWGHLEENLAYLEKWVSVADRGKIVAKLQEIVPKYRPSKRWQEEIATTGELVHGS